MGGCCHGNQDGDAARAGGAVDPDVSQHATVFPHQEEDLHVQVRTHPPDISGGSRGRELMGVSRRSLK